MLTQMEVDSDQPDAPALTLGGFMPNSAPVQIRNIEGLGPVKADVASTPWATGHGELFQGSSTPKRNIVLTLGLNPNWVDQSITSLRQLLYHYFTPETWTTLRFTSDELPEVYIRGITESFEPNIFSQDPEIQVSILCPKPDFIGVDAEYITGTSVLLAGSTFTTIDYIGTVPTGFVLRVTAASYSGNVQVVQGVGTDFHSFVVISAAIDSTKLLQLDTTKTERTLESIIISTGQEVNILAKMLGGSEWLEFTPGANLFQVVASSSLSWTLGFFNRFGGL